MLTQLAGGLRGKSPSGPRDPGHPTGRSETVNVAARLGFVAKGLLYGLVGVLALRIAFGRSGEADQTGALRAVAEQPGGAVLLWGIVAGFVGYALWRFSEAIWGHRDESGAMRVLKRLGSAANGLLYVGLAVLTWRVIDQSASGGGASTTARVLDWPGGEVLVVGVGVGIVGVAVGMTVRGLRTDFDEDLDTGRLRGAGLQLARRVGQIGYLARGVVFTVLGGLVVSAAVQHEPGKAEGFDSALKSFTEAPYGRPMLVAAAVGLICFGAYSWVEARYRRL